MNDKHEADWSEAEAALGRLDAAMATADEFEPGDTVAKERSRKAHMHAESASQAWNKRQWTAVVEEVQTAIDYLEGNK